MKNLARSVLSKSVIRSVFITLFVGSLSSSLFAQGTPYGNSSSTGSNTSWNDTQSGRVAWFEAPLTGYLTQIVFNSNQAGQIGELGIYDDQISDCGNTPSLIDSSQTITPIIGLNTIVFTPPVLLNAGVRYYFWPNAAGWAMDWASVGDSLETGTFNGNNCADQDGDVNMQFYMTTNVGVIENDFGNELAVYPNPTDGNFAVDLNENYKSVKILIKDMKGALIELLDFSDSQVLNLNIEEPAGLYLLTIESGDKKAVIRLIKE